MRRPTSTRAATSPRTALAAASAPPPSAALPDNARCAVCGLGDRVWLRAARLGRERVVLCPDEDCRLRWEASHPAMLAEALAILAMTQRPGGAAPALAGQASSARA